MPFSAVFPTVVGFKEAYLQVRKEEGAVLVCLVREINLYREDTATVVSLPQREEEELASGGP